VSRKFVLAATAGAFYTAALFDLSRELDFFGPHVARALFALAVATLLFFLPSATRKEWALLLLHLGACVSLGIRVLGSDESPFRRTSSFHEKNARDALARASSAKDRFRELTRAARAAAESAAGESSIEDAMRALAPAQLSRAFGILEARVLPRAHPSGVPGISLFDRSLRPVAWAGETRSLDRLFSRQSEFPREEVTVLRRAAGTSLVAVQPLQDGEGFVSVEIPLAADRRLENRYLQDYDALSTWADRSLDTHFFSSDDERAAQGMVFESQGDPYWVGPEENARLFFGLRSSTDELLGIASLDAEPPEPARLERRRQLVLGGGFALFAAAGAALVAFAGDRRRNALPLVAAILGFRIVLRASGIPLGLGFDLDNPAHYASSLFFGLARSPAEFLATAAALLVCAWILTRSDWRAGPLGAALALSGFLGVEAVVLDAWLNSSLALSEVSFSSADIPRSTVQLALLALFFAATLLGYRLLSPRGSAASALWDITLLALAYAALAPRGRGDLALLAALPFVALRLLPSRPIGRRVALGLLMVAVVVFFPGIAWFERISIRNFIEGTVAPAVLQHTSTRWSTLLEAAKDVDRMYDEGELDLGREDLAFAIWVATDLSVTSLSSSIEVLDPLRRLVSRFSLNFPGSPFQSDEGRPAPQEWVPAQRQVPGNPDLPPLGAARRSYLGPDLELWEIRLGVAADWRNLPFVSTSDPYLQLFRAGASETPLRYPHRELELFVLTRDGRSVFQSVGGTLDPGDDALSRAAIAPLWWEHSHEGEVHRTYLVADSEYVYAISFPKELALEYAAELTRWILLAGIAAGLGLGAAVLLSSAGVSAGIPLRDLVSGLGSRFSRKLYVAFVLLALASIFSLAFLLRGILIRDVQQDVEREAVDRALVASQLVKDSHMSRPTSALGMAPLTDSVLERVAGLVGVDVDLYIGGELLATSKPELVASGLLGSRAAPAAQREIVVERRSHSLHRQSVGGFQYQVVSVPVVLEPWNEPGILSIPLAIQELEIDRRVASLNQTLLLAAVLFSVAAAALAYFLARNIAGPIRELTEATHAVAEGSLDVSLETKSNDEIGALFSSFNQMTEDLKRQRDDLEKSKKLEAWAEMARQVAHEVKNPLTPIQLSTEHLLRVYGDPDVDFEEVLKECSATILEQVKTLRQISMEFSTFASPGPLARERTDIASLVRETVAPYRHSAPSGVRVSVEAPPEIPEVRADRRLLQRTLVNLIENALHAVDSRNGGARIDVEAKEVTRGRERFVALSVRDNGIGIDPEVKERVFEPYFSTRAAGTGLGLAIARKVVEDHGGTIRLESEPGKGTEVVIELPVHS
jgi:signal transduction histidine kinase